MDKEELSKLLKGDVVLVHNTDNYKASYAEPDEFEAVVNEITDYPCIWVQSLKTGKVYELYPHQIDFRYRPMY